MWVDAGWHRFVVAGWPDRFSDGDHRGRDPARFDDLGHYVADAQSVRGTYRFSVATTTTTGSAIGADVEIPVK